MTEPSSLLLIRDAFEVLLSSIPWWLPWVVLVLVALRPRKPSPPVADLPPTPARHTAVKDQGYCPLDSLENSSGLREHPIDRWQEPGK